MTATGSLGYKSGGSVLNILYFVQGCLWNSRTLYHWDSPQYDVGPRLLSNNQLVWTKGTTKSRLRKSGNSVHGYDILYQLTLCTSCSIWVLTQSLEGHYIASALALIAHRQNTQFGSGHWGMMPSMLGVFLLPHSDVLGDEEEFGGLWYRMQQTSPVVPL